MFCRLQIFFFEISLFVFFFLSKSFRNIIRVSNSLDPDHARRIIRPNLCPKCLQRLSADDTSRYGLKIGEIHQFLSCVVEFFLNS